MEITLKGVFIKNFSGKNCQKRSSQHTFFPVSQIATKNSDESLVQLGICR